MDRRTFIGSATLAAVAGAAGLAAFPVAGAAAPKRKMTIDLVVGNLGFAASQIEAIDLAHRCGFESVGPSADYLAGLGEEALQALLADMKAKGVVWGAAGLPVDFRGADTTFRDGMRNVPRLVAGLQRAGVHRASTWIMPGHDTLTYAQNFKLHATRLREVAQVLKDHDVRLGLEYVATKTLRDSKRLPFLHTMVEARELIGEIGTGNVGLNLDSWHWWQAGDTEADLLALKNEDVVSVDLNDAPSGIPMDQQRDGRRELPAATGVIDLTVFLNALNRIGYDGPVRAEPFDQKLKALGRDQACAVTAQAMRKAFALIR
ncbi:MAG: sugar phosphate isomerase/epimerase family protein [Limisphaerales bacterium]